MARVLIVLAIAAVLCGAPSSASAAGPNSLSAPQSSPSSGTTTTTFSFGVTYTGGFAALAVTADIAGRVLPMVLVDGDPTNGTWAVTTVLPAGTWSPTFRAVASQGKNPSIGGAAVTVGTPATPRPATPRPATPRPATPRPTTTAPSPTSAQPEDGNTGGSGPGSPPAPPPAAPVSTAGPAAPGGSGEAPAPPGPASSTPAAPAPAASAAGAGDDPLGGAASAAPDTGGPSGVDGSGPSAASASRWPSGTPAADTAPIPTESQIGSLELALGLGGVMVLALFAWFILLAGRRRRTAPDPNPSGADVHIAGATAEEQVTATLHRRTLRRSKMRLDEDPIVASLGVGAPDAEPAAHPARRTTRRSPPP